MDPQLKKRLMYIALEYTVSDYDKMSTRRRRRRAWKYSAHSGAINDFHALVERDARNLGRVGVLEDWRRNPFARNMFDLIADPRVLKKAYDSGKGKGAGSDDVMPEDIWRYYGYRKWLEACRLFGHKKPDFMSTVFPDASALHLSALLLACVPEREHRMGVISLQNRGGSDRAAVNRFEPDYFLFMSGNSLQEALDAKQFMEFKLLIHKNIPIRLKFDNECMSLRMAAGQSRNALSKLFMRVTEVIKQPILSICMDKPSDRVFAFSPFDLYLASLRSDMESGGRVNDRLVWESMRWLSDIMLKQKTKAANGFKPQLLRRLEIPKPDGGKRIISIPTVVDRTVAKAAVLILQPMFEEIFLPSSTGGRRDLTRFDALATLYNRYPASDRKYILCADIKKAFDNVDHESLLESVNRHVRNTQVQRLLERFVRREGYGHLNKGIPQGCPLSPLLLNILLHNHLDMPLAQKIGGTITYLRYVDDLCLFGLESEAEGLTWMMEVQALLRSTGLELHMAQPKTQIANLENHTLEIYGDDDELEHSCVSYNIDRYLGVGLRGTMDNRLEFVLPSSWRVRLCIMLAEAESLIANRKWAEKIEGHIHVRHALSGWIDAFAPVWASETHSANIVKEILALSCQVSSHCGQITEESITETMHAASVWWKRLVNRVN